MQVDGEWCHVVESRPVSSGLGFDRIEFSLSTRTGVSLLTRYFRGTHEIRTIRVAADNVRRFGERWLPAERRVEEANHEVLHVHLRNLMFDAVLPDQLFSEQNLRAQRFPSF
jgi:hypothetical protein